MPAVAGKREKQRMQSEGFAGQFPADSLAGDCGLRLWEEEEAMRWP